MIKNILLVGLGGSIGSMLRYGCWLLFNSKYFPFATLAVNVIGSLIIGLVFALSLKDGSFNDNWKLFIATGICGGFTTFSAFSAENMLLLQNGKYTLAFVYIVCSVIAGIAAALLGFKLLTLNS